MAGLRQVLYAADDDGKAFRVSAGTAAAYTSLNQNLLGRQQVILQDHAGGTWKMQFRLRGQADWVDVGDSVVAFATAGIVTIFVTPELEYRLTGGTSGANAWVTNVEWIEGD